MHDRDKVRPHSSQDRWLIHSNSSLARANRAPADLGGFNQFDSDLDFGNRYLDTSANSPAYVVKVRAITSLEYYPCNRCEKPVSTRCSFCGSPVCAAGECAETCLGKCGRLLCLANKCACLDDLCWCCILQIGAAAL